MKSNGSLISFVTIVSGLCVLLSVSWVKGQAKPLPAEETQAPPVASNPLAACPALPEQGPEGQVTVFVVKIPAQPGFLCARAVNGLRSPLNFKGFHLQQHDGEQFRDFTEPMPPLPPGVIIGEEAVQIVVMPGHWFDRRLPSFSPAPAGTYLACFRYTLAPSPPQQEPQEACSAEVTLP